MCTFVAETPSENLSEIIRENLTENRRPLYLVPFAAQFACLRHRSRMYVHAATIKIDVTGQPSDALGPVPSVRRNLGRRVPRMHVHTLYFWMEVLRCLRWYSAGNTITGPGGSSM